VIPGRIIERKRDGESIPSEELSAFLSAYLANEIHDYHMSAFLMATHFRGLDAAETETFVSAMLGSGTSLDLSYLDGPRVDKHSTGGVGDKVSLVLAPLAAAAGLYVPMMSGRGLGHTSGTLDKLEAVPGFRTQLTLREFQGVLERVGCAMMGQTAEIAPLDRRLYALRDVTATVPIIPLIASSIMSKKLAEGLTGLVLDVKVGDGAFIPEESRALELARLMVGIGHSHGLDTVALLTAMDRPLGRAVGNGVETAEAIACLRGGGPQDLRMLVLAQAAEMISRSDPELSASDSAARAETALDSGSALERFRQLIEAQGGDPSVVDRPDSLFTAPVQRPVLASDTGVVTGVAPRPLGQGVVALGGGRARMDEAIDLGVGFVLAVAPGDVVAEGDLLGTVHARDEAGAAVGAVALERAVDIGRGDTLSLRPLVSHRVHALGSDVVHGMMGAPD
jgi:pyrimidine-nucleoside phosphorylase